MVNVVSPKKIRAPKEKLTKSKAAEHTSISNRLTAPIAAPPELRAVAIGGSFPDTLSVISRTVANLHLLTGRVDEENSEERQKVLVPFAEFRLGGGSISDIQNLEDDTDPPTMLAATLSLENMAFLVLDLMSDLRRICGEVVSLADGDLAVDPGRMAHVRYFVAHLERQARNCRIRLDRVYGNPEEAEGGPERP